MDFSPVVERKSAYALYEKHAELWTLRILCRVFGFKYGVIHGVGVKALLRILGERHTERCSLSDAEALWRRGEEALLRREASPPPSTDAPVFANIRLLGERIGLSETEQQILALRILARIDMSLRETMERSPACDEYRLAEFLSIVLGAGPEDVLDSLRPSSALIASGLLAVDRAAHNPFNKTRLLPGLSGILMVPCESSERLFSKFARQCAPSTLAPDDFLHVAEKANILTRYLARVGIERTQGRNVLLYGPPGTGKTELARLAASEANLQCYESDVCDEDGDPLDVGGRLRALGFLQRLLQNARRGIVLFDEVEDVFKPREGPEPENRTVAAGDSKGWTVKLLETNPTPTIWISNRVYQIDPAVLRRFDLVLEIPVAPWGVRQRILECTLRCEPSEVTQLEAILRDGAPAPALLTRAAAVSEMLSPAGGADRIGQFRILLSEQMRAQGHDPMKAGFLERTPFSPEFFNSDPAPEEAVDTLLRDRSARLLVYGPSGSGKTAFAHYAAKRLGMQIHCTSVRTLYSGIAEQFIRNIRLAFERARYDGAILLLDDMDWFASASAVDIAPDRLRALSQMHAHLDDYPGKVICTSCRADALIHGFLRRFTTRLKTAFLTSSQSVRMIRCMTGLEGRHAGAVSLERESRTVPGLTHLDMLTAGDIEAASRMESAEQGHGRVAQVVRALEEIHQLKTGRPGGPIGFMYQKSF